MAHDWSELPEEIIDLVVKRLPPYPNEVIQFSCVCKSWNTVVNKLKSQRSTIPYAPWLMLAKSKNDKFKKGAIRTFYCHSTKRVFNYYLPQAKGTRCWGTPYGWLVTLGLDLNINLLHPLSRLQISLPSLLTFQHQFRGPRVRPQKLCRVFVTKFAFAFDPSSPESGQFPLVMAIYGEIRFLAIASPGDEAWTSVKCSRSNCKDIIFFKGQFYAISCTGMLMICEVNTPQPKAIDFASPPDNVGLCNRFYLVELSDDLCMVERAFDAIEDAPTLGYHSLTTYFVVYKIDFHSKMWTKLHIV
ncbi:F-box protein [Thalictrum thalictroides]|uniref:F-box protein n=1 Tax=Thalictrum thalictroides TaxID=46969 RepID=A0A7J6UZI8_THATH|nr:F-box protein [Thalictrum thalictroides]